MNTSSSDQHCLASDHNQLRNGPGMLDCQLIDVNITSSSPSEGKNKELDPTFAVNSKMSMIRTNSAKPQCLRSQGSSRKSSTITFQTPPTIKRPNSTIGIPTSVIPSSQSMFNNLSDDKPCSKFSTIPHEPIQYNSNNSSNYNINSTGLLTTIKMPELDFFESSFNPIIREKAASLTLPDSKLHFLRKGSSNPFLTTNSG